MIDIEPTHLTIVKMPETPKIEERRPWPLSMIAALAIALVGIGLRLWLPIGFQGMGFDEALYRAYVIALDERGLGDYDTISQDYLVNQRLPNAVCKLPPTRFLYVYCGWIWKRSAFGDAAPVDIKQHADVAHDPALVSLHRVSLFFSILLLLLSGVAAWRILGKPAALVVLALMATAPLQLHMGGHALIDGFFAFWAMLALWSLWENLRQPNHPGWLSTYGIALLAMVLTKENAFFVAVAIAALLGANRWARFGTVTRRLLSVSVLGPLFGATLLVRLAGSVPKLVEIYRLLVSKAEHLDYALLTGGGPWYRYLIDELALSPFVLCLALGAVFALARRERPLLFFSAFIIATYAVMCQVRHGMNVRYATIWDLPLCALAAGQLLDLSRLMRRGQYLWLSAATAGICGYELWQYWTFFVKEKLYELPTESLLQAVDILKS